MAWHSSTATHTCSAPLPSGVQGPASHRHCYFVLLYQEAEESYNVETAHLSLRRSSVRPISFSAPESPLAVTCIIYSSNHQHNLFFGSSNRKHFCY